MNVALMVHYKEAALKRGLLLAVFSSICFGASGPVGKALVGAGFEPLQAAWLRMAGAALVLVPLVLLLRGLSGIREARPYLPQIAAYGLTGIIGCQALYFVAASRLPVGIASMLEFTGPVFVLLWIKFVRRGPVRRSAAIGIGVAVAGLACVVEVWSGLRLDALGIAAGFGSAACQAAYFLIVDKMSDKVDPIVMTAGGMTLGMAALAVIATPWTAPWSVLGEDIAFGTGTAPTWALVAWIVLVATVLAYVLGVRAVQLLDAQLAAAICYTEVVATIVIAWLALGERLTALQLTGGAIVISGAYIAQRSVGTGAMPPVAERDAPVPTGVA